MALWHSSDASLTFPLAAYLNTLLNGQLQSANAPCLYAPDFNDLELTTTHTTTPSPLLLAGCQDPGQVRVFQAEASNKGGAGFGVWLALLQSS